MTRVNTISYLSHHLASDTKLQAQCLDLISVYLFVEKYQKIKIIPVLREMFHYQITGAQWLSGMVLDSRPRGHGFQPHRRHCVVVLEQDTLILAKYWFNPGRPVPA